MQIHFRLSSLALRAIARKSPASEHAFSAKGGFAPCGSGSWIYYIKHSAQENANSLSALFAGAARYRSKVACK